MLQKEAVLSGGNNLARALKDKEHLWRREGEHVFCAKVKVGAKVRKSGASVVSWAKVVISGKGLPRVRLKACWLPTEGPALGERQVMMRDRSQSAVGGTWVCTLTSGVPGVYYPSSVSQVSPLSNRGEGCDHLSSRPSTKQGSVIVKNRGGQTQEPFSVLKPGAGLADPWSRASPEQCAEDGLALTSSWEKDDACTLPHLLLSPAGVSKGPRCAGAAVSCQIF